MREHTLANSHCWGGSTGVNTATAYSLLYPATKLQPRPHLHTESSPRGPGRQWPSTATAATAGVAAAARVTPVAGPTAIGIIYIGIHSTPDHNYSWSGSTATFVSGFDTFLG